MKIEDVPAYVVPINTSLFCDIDDCPNWADYHYRNPTSDPDAFQVWDLCGEHALELDNRLEANETT